MTQNRLAVFKSSIMFCKILRTLNINFTNCRKYLKTYDVDSFTYISSTTSKIAVQMSTPSWLVAVAA